MLILIIFSPLTLGKGTNVLYRDAKIEVMTHEGLGSSAGLVPLCHTTQSQTFKIVLVRVSRYLGQSPVPAKKRDDSV